MDPEKITPPGPVHPEPAQSAQVAHPAQAVKRTAVQAFLADVVGWILFLGVVLPVAAQVVSEELSGVLPDAWLGYLAGAAAVVAAVAAAITRIMAIPKVDAVLQKVRLGSRPTP